MFEALARFFTSDDFMPHGHCFLWQPYILWLHVISDAVIVTAYYAIPLALVYFARMRQDLPYKGIFWWFGAFILLCGTSHLMEILVIWHPYYALEGVIKALTALVSIVTLVLTIRMIPQALILASPSQLKQLNDELKNHIRQRDMAEHELRDSQIRMEEIIAERTAELIKSNSVLHSEVLERKKSQEHMHKLLDELTRSNGELQRFAYICSHDLQEPVRMVSSYAQLLERRLDAMLDEDTRKYMHFLTDSADRMRAVIQGILAYARVENHEGHFTQVDCGKVVQEVLLDLEAIITETGAQVHYEGLPTVWGDPVQFMQLFQNLITNAIKFRKKGLVPEITISARYAQHEWTFSVRDNGIGIKPEYFAKIFQLFQRLNRKEDYPGTGIGLAICKKIVERYGGRISVESAENEGATFSFTLPDYKPEEE